MNWYVEDRSEATVGSGCTGHTNRRAGYLTGDRGRSAVAGALAVQWRSMSPRPLLQVVVNVGANHEVAGSLVLLFKELIELQVRVSLTGPSSM